MDDRRKFFRFEAPLTVRYATEKDVPETRSRTSNISREGVAFTCAKKFTKDELIKMQFDIPGESIPAFAQGKVVWVYKSGATKKNSF